MAARRASQANARSRAWRDIISPLHRVAVFSVPTRARPCNLAADFVCPVCVAMTLQARRLESQLYQRAQDMRTIEMAQRQSALARSQVRHLLNAL